MIFRDLLYTLAGSKAKARVLGVMAARPFLEWTGNALAKEAGVSQPQAWKALNLLEKQGIVRHKRGAGKAVLWSFNDKHLAAPALRDFARPERVFGRVLVKRLREAGALEGVVRIVLFGSVARGEEEPGSDVDLFVEVENRARQRKVRDAVISALAALDDLTGSPANPVFYSTAQIRDRKRSGLLKEITRDGTQLYPA